MIVLDNGICLYNSRTAADFLESIGISRLDFEKLCEYISDEYDPYAIEYWKTEAKEWKLDSAHEYEKREGLICAVQDLADELASGKGGTKVQYAQRLRDACEFWA